MKSVISLLKTIKDSSFLQTMICLPGLVIFLIASCLEYLKIAPDTMHVISQIGGWEGFVGVILVSLLIGTNLVK